MDLVKIMAFVQNVVGPSIEKLADKVVEVGKELHTTASEAAKSQASATVHAARLRAVGEMVASLKCTTDAQASAAFVKIMNDIQPPQPVRK